MSTEWVEALSEQIKRVLSADKSEVGFSTVHADASDIRTTVTGFFCAFGQQFEYSLSGRLDAILEEPKMVPVPTDKKSRRLWDQEL